MVGIESEAAAWLCLGGTPWPTGRGALPVERLLPGDTVPGADGPCAVRWVGRLHLAAAALAGQPALWPVHVAPAALGEGWPAGALAVLPAQVLEVPGFAPAAARWLVDGRGLSCPVPTAAMDVFSVVLAGGGPPRGVACLREGTEILPARPEERGLLALRRHLAARSGWVAAPLQGSLDVVTRRRVSGWVAEAGAAVGKVAVELEVDGVALPPVPADRFRADLAAAGIGDGHYGFEFVLDPPPDPRRRHLVRVRRAIDGADLPGSPALLDAAIGLGAALAAFDDPAALRAAAGEAARALAMQIAPAGADGDAGTGQAA